MSERSITRAEWRWVAAVSALILLVTLAPVLYGVLVAPPDYHYIGFAYNGEEANPYLAKIEEGARGDWLYAPPYNADPGEPFFLYENYILLGHISRWLSLEPLVVFHLARLAGGALMFFTLYWFIARFFVEVRDRQLAFGLAAFGAGFGWLVRLFQYNTADLWQAQIFPFLAVFANIHFPPAVAATLWIADALMPADGERVTRGRLAARLAAGALLLALTQPYSLVVAGALGALWFGWRLVRSAPRAELAGLLGRLALVVALAGPFALYYRWLAVNNAAYAGWDRQNYTPSSPPWDYAISFGPILPLTLVGAALILRRVRRARDVDADALLLAGWTALTVVLMYWPSMQQRRFAFALAVPVAVLAVQGLKALPRIDRGRARIRLMYLCSLTNVLLLLLVFMWTTIHLPAFFFTRGEWEGLLYLRREAPQRALVLTSPDMGLYIPAWAGQRVFYGHAHETLDAPARFAEVTAYFAGTLADPAALLNRADFIFVGPRERKLGAPTPPANFRVVFTSPGPDGVTIYRREP